MIENKVSATLTDQNVTDVDNFISQILAILTFLVTLEVSQRKSLRKMGNKREGYVSDVLKAVKAFVNELPSNYSITEFEKDKNVVVKLSDIRELVVGKLVEKLDDTILQVNHELMQHADVGYALLKVIGRNNISVKSAVKAIGENNKGMGRTANLTFFDVTKAGGIEVNNAIPGTNFINCGSTGLKLAAGSELSSKLKKPIMSVLPGQSVAIPIGYTQIYVTNDSADTQGMFAIRTSK